MNTRDRDEILISTVIKLIKRKTIPNLKNVIAKTHSADIAPWFPRLRPEEQIILFDLLIQEGRMGEVLNGLIPPLPRAPSLPPQSTCSVSYSTS